MKSFSIRRSQVAKQNRETIVKIADTIYIKRRRWFSSNCESRREDNNRTNPIIMADRYAFSDVWTSGEHDSFVILTFACNMKIQSIAWLRKNRFERIINIDNFCIYFIIFSKCCASHIFLPNSYEAEIGCPPYWLCFFLHLKIFHRIFWQRKLEEWTFHCRKK